MTEAVELERDDGRMFTLCRLGDGTLRLDVVLGGVGLFRACMELNAKERERYAREGRDYLDRLVYRVNKKYLTEYKDRLRPCKPD